MHTKKNKKIDPKSQLTRLVDKPALTRSEKQWLLGYLENTDAQALREMMLASFNSEEPPDADDPLRYEKMIEAIHRKIGH